VNKLKAIILSFALAFQFEMQAQNLVMNPSFENVQYYIQCSNDFPIINWKRNLEQSFFMSLYNDSNQCFLRSMPYSLSIGYQHPRTGVSATVLFVGDTVISGGHFNPGGRSYLIGQLYEPMQAGKRYCVEFYVNKANRDQYLDDEVFYFLLSINQFHLKFSTTPIVYNNGWFYGDGYDLVLQDSLQDFLTDTLDWHRIYNHHEAKGDEKHFMFGNFSNNLDTEFHLRYKPHPLSTPQDVISSYYFIDDASITLIPEFKINTSRNKISPYQNAVLYANTSAENIKWYALPDTVNAIGVGDSIIVTPKESTSYAAKAEQCRYVSWDTVQITVTPTALIGDLAVYNNITQNQFTIRYLDRAPLQMYLFNTAGQIVRAIEFSATTEVDISDLAAGVYYCRIMMGGEFLMVERVVKMN